MFQQKNAPTPQRKKSVGASGWGVGAPQPNANVKLAVCPQPNPKEIFENYPQPNPIQQNFGRNLQPWPQPPYALTAQWKFITLIQKGRQLRIILLSEF